MYIYLLISLYNTKKELHLLATTLKKCIFTKKFAVESKCLDLGREELSLLSGASLHVSDSLFGVFECVVWNEERSVFVQVSILVTLLKIFA